jgi:hypothetical protein
MECPVWTDRACSWEKILKMGAEIRQKISRISFIIKDAENQIISVPPRISWYSNQ